MEDLTRLKGFTTIVGDTYQLMKNCCAYIDSLRDNMRCPIFCDRAGARLALAYMDYETVVELPPTYPAIKLNGCGEASESNMSR
jgi:hypothetical protein